MGMTPCAPFVPMVVERAKGDIGYTAAFILLSFVATIVVMPLAVPLMIEGADRRRMDYRRTSGSGRAITARDRHDASPCQHVSRYGCAPP